MIFDSESIWAMIGTLIGFGMGLYVGWNLYKYKIKKEMEKWI